MGELCGMLASLERHVSHSAVRQCHILLQYPLNITKYMLSLHRVPKAALLCAGSGGDTQYMERRFFWGMLQGERKSKKTSHTFGISPKCCFWLRYTLSGLKGESLHILW